MINVLPHFYYSFSKYPTLFWGKQKTENVNSTLFVIFSKELVNTFKKDRTASLKPGVPFCLLLFLDVGITFLRRPFSSVRRSSKIDLFCTDHKSNVHTVVIYCIEI